MDLRQFSGEPRAARCCRRLSCWWTRAWGRQAWGSPAASRRRRYTGVREALDLPEESRASAARDHGRQRHDASRAAHTTCPTLSLWHVQGGALICQSLSESARQCWGAGLLRVCAGVPSRRPSRFPQTATAGEAAAPRCSFHSRCSWQPSCTYFVLIHHFSQRCFGCPVARGVGVWCPPLCSTIAVRAGESFRDGGAVFQSPSVHSCDSRGSRAGSGVSVYFSRRFTQTTLARSAALSSSGTQAAVTPWLFSRAGLTQGVRASRPALPKIFILRKDAAVVRRISGSCSIACPVGELPLGRALGGGAHCSRRRVLGRPRRLQRRGRGATGVVSSALPPAPSSSPSPHLVCCCAPAAVSSSLCYHQPPGPSGSSRSRCC